MLNLLSAGFVRLHKSRLFWFFIAAETVWSAFLAWLLHYYGNLKENLNIYLFMTVFYVCVAEAVFCGFYIGTDYSDGTVRNKIAVGQTRESIYLSNLIICCFAGTAVLLTHIAVFLAVGLMLVGPVILPQTLLIKLLCAVVSAISGAALFTLIPTLISKIASALAVNIFTSLGLIISGIYVFAKYSQPAFFSDGTANRRYAGGAAKAILGIFESVLPTSSALELMAHGSFSVCIKIILCSLAVAAVFTLIGLLAFRRKNIN